MATPIKRIEKDFYIKALYDEQLPIIFLRNRTEYVLRMERPAEKDIFLQADRPIPGLKPRRGIPLIFEYHTRIITFTVEIETLRDTHITGKTPEFLYKDLNRSHSRVLNPPDLNVQFSLMGDRYALPFPKVGAFESGEPTDSMQNQNTSDLNGLIARMGVWIKGFSGEHTLVLFKDKPPTATEERILAETGKAIFLPSTKAAAGSPASIGSPEASPKKKLVTEDMFKRYLESVGVGKKYLDEALSRFIRSKFEDGIFSDAWVPILFQEYVIGYIHVWIGAEDIPPLTNEILDALFQFARVLAFSLKTNGYFDEGMLTNKPFTGAMLDISASGMLFSYPSSDLTSALLPDAELELTLSAPIRQPPAGRPGGALRTIKAKARIVRRFTDRTTNYFGCQFLDIAPEDTRFLFEFIYGRPFTDDDAIPTDAHFLSGHV
ncbi:hypothetical protein FACS1894137_00160 [Spirochaetia bacterium]|nr:hypothetical protein FACS1894137_00160 [Spirochaetia bacterium]